MDIFYSFFITSLAGLATMLGTFVIFFSSKNKDKIIISSLSFAAGVMVCVSLLDLMPESLNMLNNNLNLFLSIMAVDKYLPETKENTKLYRVGIISMLAIILHNIPEGIATFMASSMDKTLGISLAIAIAMHNLPEGISIAVPIYSSTNKKSKAFIYTFISAISEPFGALIAFIFLKNFVNDIFMGLLFSFIAGIMIHISFYELLPESKRYKNYKLTSIFFIIGIIFMCINLFLF